MKTNSLKSVLLDALFVGVLIAFVVSMTSCATLKNPGEVTSTQQTIANAVTDALSIGLVPVLAKNPTYVPAAQAVAGTLGSFAGTTITPEDVDAFLAKTNLAPADQKVVAGVVNAAWGVYSKRYAATVGANVRPDVKLFLGAVSDGILAACAAVPKTSAAIIPNAKPEQLVVAPIPNATTESKIQYLVEAPITPELLEVLRR